MLTASKPITMGIAKPVVNIVHKNSFSPASHFRKIGALIVGTVMMIALTGCGQKGDLYLVDNDSQMVSSSSEVLDSTSNPQDAAFGGVDDVDYQKTRYLEQKQVLPDVTDDPNDY